MGNMCNQSAKATKPPLEINLTSNDKNEKFNGAVWCAACRPEGKPNEISEELWMFQPDLTTGASEGCTPRSSSRWLGSQNVVDIRSWNERQDLLNIPKKQTIMVYIHGVTVTYPAVIERIKQVHECCPCTVVGFVWPGTSKARTKTGKVIGYIHSKTLAEKAAMSLVELIHVLWKHGNTVHLLGHSMGARLILKTLLRVQALREQPPIGHTFLIAAAVPAVSLCKTDQFPLDKLAGKGITVFTSTNDDVLPHGYKLVEFVPGLLQKKHSSKQQITAMGIRGPCFQDEQGPHKKVTTIDLSAEVHSHHAFNWLSSPTCQKKLCETMCLKAPAVPFIREMNEMEKQQHAEMVRVFQAMPDFNDLDKDDDGFIKSEEMREAFGSELSAQEVDDMIQQFDSDGDGRVCYVEFVQMVASRQSDVH